MDILHTKKFDIKTAAHIALSEGIPYLSSPTISELP